MSPPNGQQPLGCAQRERGTAASMAGSWHHGCQSLNHLPNEFRLWDWFRWRHTKADARNDHAQEVAWFMCLASIGRVARQGKRIVDGHLIVDNDRQ